MAISMPPSAVFPIVTCLVTSSPAADPQVIDHRLILGLGWRGLANAMSFDTMSFPWTVIILNFELYSQAVILFM